MAARIVAVVSMFGASLQLDPAAAAARTPSSDRPAATVKFAPPFRGWAFPYNASTRYVCRLDLRCILDLSP